MGIRKLLRPIIAAVIVVAWVGVELLHGVNQPTLELRLILVSSLIYLFGESVFDAVEIIRGSGGDQGQDADADADSSK
jgi:type IV secretory pathway VirB2 component (pilin)